MLYYVFLGLVFLYWICLLFLNKKHKFIFTHFLVNNYEASCITSKADLIDFFIRVRNVFSINPIQDGRDAKRLPLPVFPL